MGARYGGHFVIGRALMSTKSAT